MNFWAPLKVPALRFVIVNLNLDESLFLCVFLYLHSGTGMQAQSGELLNLEFCHAISNAKDSKGVEGVCKNITVMNDNGISADMETKEKNGGGVSGSWVIRRSQVERRDAVVREQDISNQIDNDNVYGITWRCIAEAGWRTRTLEKFKVIRGQCAGESTYVYIEFIKK